MSHGPRVLGKKAWQDKQAQAKQRADDGPALGPRVTGKKVFDPSKAPAKAVAAPAPAPAVPETPPAPDGAGDATQPPPSDEGGKGGEPTSISIDQMDVALKANQTDALRDKLIDAEFSRPEGQPRKGALQLLIQAEKAREEGPREAVIKELQKAMRVN